jgi:Trk K+ transport system NAD-binding subunit
MTNKPRNLREARLAERIAKKIGLEPTPSLVESPEYQAYLESDKYNKWLCSPAADQVLNPNRSNGNRISDIQSKGECIRDPEIALELAQRRVAALKEIYGERIEPGAYTKAVLARAKKAEQGKKSSK